MSNKPKFAPTSKRQAWFLESETFLTIFGGAASGGKSYVGLMRFLKYIDDPEFIGYVFRKNSTDLKKEGGLFWDAVKMFQSYDPEVTYTTQPMVIKFPHPDPKERKRKKRGATISFTGLDDQEGMNAIQGINISAALVDEACQIGEEEFWWLTTRLRTNAKMSPNIWLTCNPDFSSFVLKQFVNWFLYPRGTIGDVLKADLLQEDVNKLQVNDGIYVVIKSEFGQVVKTVELGANIVYKDNIKFFTTSGSVSVNNKVLNNGTRLEVVIPRLTDGQTAALVFKRWCPERQQSFSCLTKELDVVRQEDIGGRPDLDKNGKELYYLNVDNKVHLAETLDALYEELPEFKNHPTIEPKKVRWIGATCKDNPTYLLKNPAYESTLQNQPRLKREQLYYGNWYAQEEGAGYFRREWIHTAGMLKKMPPDDEIQRRVRCFDLAGSVPTEANPDPDWTVGVLMAKTKSGFYIIEDVIRFRKRAGEVEEELIKIVQDDRKRYGSNYKAYLPQDPAAAGKTTRIYYSKMFAARGVPIHFVKVGSKSSKLKRFEPFAASSENELVQCIESDWNEEYFFELEVFTGTRSKHHDDQVDATSDAFNILATKKELPKFSGKKLKTK